MVKISLNEEEQKREKIEIIDDVYQIPKLEGTTKKAIVTGRNKVNLHYLNCSCAQYRQSAGKYPRRDIRRVCKHLYAKLFSEVESNLDSLTKMLLHNQFWFGQYSVKKIKFYDEMILVGLHKKHQIVSVFKTTNDTYSKFIFDLLIDGWANDEKPFDDQKKNTECIKLIKELSETHL